MDIRVCMGKHNKHHIHHWIVAEIFMLSDLISARVKRGNAAEVIISALGTDSESERI